MLKTVLDTLDGVDDAVKALYAEKDGKHVLQIDGIDAHPEVATLKNAYERVKADKAAMKADADKAKADLAEAMKGKPDEAALVAERQRYEGQIADLTAKLVDAEGKLIGFTRDQAFRSALTEAGITDEFYVDLLTAKHAADVKIIDGKPMVEGAMGPESIQSWAKKQAAGPWSKAVTPAQGGGAGGSQGQLGGKKPEDMSAQDRAALLRSNPAEFYRLFPHAKTT